MQVRVKLFVVSIVILAALIIGLMFINRAKGNYFYNYSYDDNKVSQSVIVYNRFGKKMSGYYLIFNGEPITYTNSTKAVVTMNIVDLKDGQTLKIAFDGEIDKQFDVIYKK